MSESFLLQESYVFTYEVIKPEDLQQENILEILSVYKDGYQNKWFGDELYINNTLPNTNQVFILKNKDKIVGCTNLNYNRIISFSVCSEFQHKGISQKLLCIIKEQITNPWVTVGVADNKMQKTLSKAGFTPCLDQNLILNMFSQIKGVANLQIHFTTDQNFDLANTLGSTNTTFLYIMRNGIKKTAQYVFII